MYIPLDERPCNYIYPQRLADEADGLNFRVPPKGILGQKKVPADLSHLWQWIEENFQKCDYIIASIDMLVYGGIVPSRIHSYDKAECEERLKNFVKLKSIKPELKIYAFNLIMRVPSYNSSEEEPDYYAQYGRDIFEYSWLTDKIACNKADASEAEMLGKVKDKIPAAVLNDYEQRRFINAYINEQAIKLVSDNIIDFLIIPLDDCAEYGFSALEQRKLIKYVEQADIQDKVYLYPGADEVGCTLTAKVFNLINNKEPRVFVRYSSIAGPFVIPLYEDRPLGESIKYHIIAAGGILVDDPDSSDFVLFVNSPPSVSNRMAEAPNAVNKDPSYYSMRNLRELVKAMRYYTALGKKCALADVAFGNGADNELMHMLSKQHILSDLTAYAGWNTSSNTLGTVISHAMIRYSMLPDQCSIFLVERFIEDWAYQSIARQQLAEEIKQMNVSQYDLDAKTEQVANMALSKLNAFIVEQLKDFKDMYNIKDVYFPWNRLFEIGINVEIRAD